MDRLWEMLESRLSTLMILLYPKLNFDLNCFKSAWSHEGLQSRMIRYLSQKMNLNIDNNTRESQNWCKFKSMIFTWYITPPWPDLQHICTALMERRVNHWRWQWPSWRIIFPSGENQREGPYYRRTNSLKYIMYKKNQVNERKYLVIRKISLSTDRHLLRRVIGHGDCDHYHYDHDDHYHSTWHLLVTKLPCVLWWNNEPPLALYSIISIIRHSRLITNIEQTEKLIPHHSPFLSPSP